MGEKKSFFEKYEDSLNFRMYADEVEFTLPQETLEQIKEMPKEQQEYVAAIYLGLHTHTFPHLNEDFMAGVSPDDFLLDGYNHGKQLRKFSEIAALRGNPVLKHIFNFSNVDQEVSLLTDCGIGYYAAEFPDIAWMYEEELTKESIAYKEFQLGKEIRE